MRKQQNKKRLNPASTQRLVTNGPSQLAHNVGPPNGPPAMGHEMAHRLWAVGGPTLCARSEALFVQKIKAGWCSQNLSSAADMIHACNLGPNQYTRIGQRNVVVASFYHCFKVLHLLKLILNDTGGHMLFPICEVVILQASVNKIEVLLSF